MGWHIILYLKETPGGVREILNYSKNEIATTHNIYEAAHDILVLIPSRVTKVQTITAFAACIHTCMDIDGDST